MHQSRSQHRTVMLVQEAVLVALIAIGAFIRLPLVWMDYFDLGPLFVLWAGYLLGPWRGARVVAVYTLLGLLGVPVFVEGGGLGYILKPTFGYLIGYMAAAWLAGYLVRGHEQSGWPRYLWMTFLCFCAVYVCGIGYKWFLVNIYFNEVLPLWAIMSASLIPMPAEVTLFGLASFLVVPRLHREIAFQIKE